MSNRSRLVQKLVLVFLLLNLSVCPILFAGMMFFPNAIHILEPVVCPADTQMQITSELRSDQDGTYTWTKVFCIDNQREMDITWKIFLIMFGFPLLGVIVFLIAPSSKNKEKEKVTLNPGY